MNAELAIVGGGPAGSALAVQLAARRRDVVLVEREAKPKEKVCGEFLSAGAQHDVAALGIDLLALGAVPLHAVRLAVGRRTVTADLPFSGLSLSRSVLDEAILGAAQGAGAVVMRGRRATALAAGNKDWRVSLGDDGWIDARHVVLATGKHDLRGWNRPAGRQSDLIAFKMHLRLAASAARALAGHVELFLFAGGYAGLQPLPGDAANLCLVLRSARYAALGRRWEAVLEAIAREAPLLAERIDGAVQAWPKPLSIARIPYGLIAEPRDGVWRLGDQAAVIPSFAGDGIAIALHSSRLAATSMGQGETPYAFQRRLAADLRTPIGRASLLSRVMLQPSAQRAFTRLAGWRPEVLAAIAQATRVPVARRPDG